MKIERQDPIRVLSFGAGVQSTTLLMLILNRDERLLSAMGGHVPNVAIFADPRNESQSTYAHIWRMAQVCAEKGFTLLVASAGDLAHDILHAERFASIPAFTKSTRTGRVGLLRRQCTREYKIDVIHHMIRRRLAGLSPRQHMKIPVESWIGISLDEINRAKPSRDKWETKIFPLIEMGWRRGDCLNYLASQGLEQVGKSACVFCPFHRNSEWLRMKREDPEGFERACKLDESIRDMHMEGRGDLTDGPLYLHRSCVPLRDADVGEDQGDLFDPWDNECEGMCGV